MVDPNTRQGKRTPVTLKIKFKSETLEQFIERYAVDVSQGGIFIRTKEPLAVGTQMKFEFQLRDASPLIGGEGTVVWTRENDPSRPAIAPGMGVRFDRLAEGSQGVLERILSEKAKQSPSRPSEVTKPPMFTDTPTRVAPAPVQDALLGRSPTGRSRADSFSETSNTPLPRPMPFHSDADDFDERAFEEATKVRSLDELAAQSIGDTEATATNILPAAPPDELLDRKRADSTLADAPSAMPARTISRDLPAAPARTNSRELARSDSAVRPDPIHEPEPSRPGGVIIDRDSAPGLPSPPVPAPKMVDTPTLLGTAPPARTQLGLEPARVETRQRESVAPPISIKDAPTRPTGLQAVTPPPKAATPKERAASSSQHMPAGRRPSSAPIVIGILVALAAIGAAVWFFVLRPPENSGDDVVKKAPPPGSDMAVTPPDNGSNGSAPDNGSNGSAVADTGSNGSGAVTPPPPPKADTVDTVIASSIEKATVEVVGERQSGPAPFTAKLEKGKAYKVKISAARYADKLVDVKGGDAKVVAKLDAKPSTIHVDSDPPGAQVFVDNAPTSVKTPGDITLTAAQAARKTLHISVRMAGKKPFDHIVDMTSLTEGTDKITGSIDAGKLATMVIVQRPNPPIDHTGSGSATTNTNGSGGDAVTPDKGSGAEKPPTPPTPPTPPSGSGSGEPEPDWTKKNN